MIKIDCKSCGTEDSPLVEEGSGPHAYKATCVHCGHFSKWLSKYDVEDFSEDFLIARHHELSEHVSNNEGVSPFSSYANELRELKRVNAIMDAKGVVA